MLELFEGKVGIEHIMTLEIPLVYELIEAKEKLLKEKEKIRMEYERAQASMTGKRKK